MLTFIVYIIPAKPKTLFSSPELSAPRPRTPTQNLEFTELSKSSLFFLLLFSLGRRQLQPVNITSLSEGIS